MTLDRLRSDPSSGDDAAAAPEPAAAPVERRRLAHVLIVDDNEINLRVARSLCEVLGHTCDYARDGSEAVQAVKDKAFDLILMDICMPGMDGIEATRAIRALPGPPGQTPIIAVTANVEPSDVKSYGEAGMDAVVAKPIKVSQLFQAMGEALSGRAPPQIAN